MSEPAEFKPFTSGCGKCNPSTDYYKINHIGGKGNYSNDGLIPESNGKNMFETPNFDVPMSKIIKDNYNIGYSTAFGGKKSSTKKSSSKKTPTKKSSTKKSPSKKMKGGME